MDITIKEIVYMAGIFGQLDEVVQAIDDNAIKVGVGGELQAIDDMVTQDTLDTIGRLVRCANLVINEVATEYLPLRVQELVMSVDGLIAYEYLTKNLIDIISIVKNNEKIKYRLSPTGIVVPSGKYRVEYNYLPNKYVYDSIIDYKTAMITARVLGYGVVCEYCIISGMATDAVMWDKRYRDSLVMIKSRTEKKLKNRAFY